RLLRRTAPGAGQRGAGNRDRGVPAGSKPAVPDAAGDAGADARPGPDRRPLAVQPDEPERRLTTRPRATAIINPHTGRREAHELEAMLQSTLGRVYDVRVLRTGYPGEARDLARQSAKSSDVVLAVGGDGTVADVASGLVGSNTPLAIIPTGSANAVARS